MDDQPDVKPGGGWRAGERRIEAEDSLEAGSEALDAAEVLAHQACREYGEHGADGGRPPTHIGSYRIVRELGRGGQGVVFLARDERLGRDVALKILPWNTGVAERRRLQREAEITARLDLPEVCKVFEVGRHEGVTFVAMQPVAGIPLTERIRAAAGEGPVDVGAEGDRSTRSVAERIDAVLEFVAKVARAVHRFHLEGVVHRDLKPGNVMLTQRGDPVVLDFGLARSDDAGLESLTVTGDVFGTPAYMAPELLGDEPRPADRGSDVWALGCILWELLFGRRPFDAPTRAALIAAIREEPLPVGRRLLPQMPPELEAVAQVALEREVTRRYESAGALANDLERVLARLPVAARKAPWMLRARRAIQRHPLRYAIGALSLLFVTVTPTIVAVQAKRNAADLRREQVRADEHAERLLVAIDETLIELGASGLSQIPGEEERRRKLLNSAVEKLNRLEREPALEERVAAHIANIHFQLARLGAGTRRSTDALHHMRRVLELLERHPNIAMTAASRRFAEQTARTWIATALSRQGDLEGAQRELELAEQSPHLRDDPLSRASLDLHRASSALERRDWNESLARSHAALANLDLVDPQSLEAPETPRMLTLTSAECQKVRGMALRMLGQNDDALLALEAADNATQAAEIERFNFFERNKLVEILQAKAEVLRRLSRSDDAVASIDRAVAILADIRGLEPDSVDHRYLEGQARVIRIEMLRANGAEQEAIAEIDPTLALLTAGWERLRSSAHVSMATVTTVQRLARVTRRLRPRDHALLAKIHAAAYQIGVAALHIHPQHGTLARVVSSAARDHAYYLRREGDGRSGLAVLEHMRAALESAVGLDTTVVPASERFQVLRDLARDQARLRDFLASHETSAVAAEWAQRTIDEESPSNRSLQYRFVAHRARLEAAFELDRWNEIAAACDAPMRFVAEFVEGAGEERAAKDLLTHPLYTGSGRLLNASRHVPTHLRVRLAFALLKLNAELGAAGHRGSKDWDRTRQRLTERWVALLGAALQNLYTTR